MKQKVFGYSFIFLVIFQLFSPWMMNFSKTGITLNKNTARAATYQRTSSTTADNWNDRTEVIKDHSNAFFVVTALNDGVSLGVSSYTSPDYKINNLSIDFVAVTTTSTCPGGDISIIQNKALSTLKPVNKGLVGFDSTYTTNNLYLKTDYTIDISSTNLKTDCVYDNTSLGSDAYGHYEFTYQVEDVNGKRWKYLEYTTTGEAVEDSMMKKEKSKGILFTSAQYNKGNNFDISWGVLTPTKLVSAYTCGNSELIGESKKSSTMSSSQTSTTSIIHDGQGSNPKKVTYLHEGKDYTIYENFCSTSVDDAVNKPDTSNGGKDYTLNFKRNYAGFNASAGFNFSLPITGKAHSFYPFNDTNNTDSTLKGSCVADFCLKDFSVEPGDLSKKDGKIYVQTKISILLSDANVKKFVPFSDKNDTSNPSNNGIADSGDNPGDWAAYLDDDKNKGGVDYRPACEGNGFYLIWGEKGDTIDYKVCDHPAGVEVNGDGYHEINLNEYMFGEKMKPSPIIAQKASGMVFEIPVGDLDYGKTYFFKLYGADAGQGVFDLANDGYSVQVSRTVDKDINDITQDSRDGFLVKSGDQLEAEIDWLPECSGTDAATWFQGCMVKGFYYLIFVPTSALLAFAGYMLDKVLIYSISPDAYKAQYIVDGWRFIRDLCNLFFIFMLIYLAFKVILGIGHGTKQLIVNTLIIATVINFSYPLATIVIDVSNITARQLYYNAFNKKDASSGEPLGLSATAASGYNPQKLIVDAMETSGLDKEKEKGSIFLILLIGVIFNIIAMFMFLRIAMQFIFRILGLVFAIILSPLAVFSFSLDKETRSKIQMVGFDQWLSGLLTDCFKAPVFLFLVLVMTLFISDNPFKAALSGDVNGLEWWMSLIIPFALIMGFLMIIEGATKKMSSGLSNMASEQFMKYVGKAGSFAIGGAAGLVTGGAATLGRSTIGKWAAKSAENIRNNGKDNWINRQRLKTLDKTAKASFDVRQSAIGSTITKQTGINLDNPLIGKIPGMSTAATAGGYMAMKDRAKKKEIDRAELLGHDKKLEENLNHEKENKEAELKDIEKDDEINRSLLKELSQQLKENTEALESQEKSMTAYYDGKIKEEDEKVKDNDDIVRNSNVEIARLNAQLTSTTDPAEKTRIQNEIRTQMATRTDAMTKKTDAIAEKRKLETQKDTNLRDLKESSPNGQAVTKIKGDIKTAKEKEAELSKKKNDIKFGVEIEVVKKDSHGHISYEKDSAGNVVIDPTTGKPKPQMVKVRSGGIAGVDKAISRVKNNRMLEATLRHKRKSTGDAIELKTYLQKYTEDFNGDETKAIAQLQKEFGENYEKVSKTNYAGSAGKPGHMHEITHMINDHFHPEQHKSNYKPPAGGGAKPPSNDHGHDAGHSDPAHH